MLDESIQVRVSHIKSPRNKYAPATAALCIKERSDKIKKAQKTENGTDYSVKTQNLSIKK